MQIARLDELHRLAETLYTETETLPKEQRKKQICEEIEELLILAYIFGTDRVLGDIAQFEKENGISSDTTDRLREQLRTRDIPAEIREALQEGSEGDLREPPEIPFKARELYETVYKPIAGETFEQRVDRRLREGTLTEESLERIIDTDYHRCEETGAYNTAVNYAEENGRTPYKIWRTMLDDRVRETHWYIEGVEVPMDERFYTFDNDSARFPGDFEKVENNANCRCWLTYTFR